MKKKNKKKKKKIKTSQIVSPRVALNVGHPGVGMNSDILNCYWATFHRMPSLLGLDIPNPINKDFVKSLALSYGYRAESFSTSKSWVEDEVDERAVLLVNKKKKVFVTSMISYSKSLTVAIVCPVEELEYAKQLAREFKVGVGSKAPRGYISLLGFSDGCFMLRPIEIRRPTVDLALNYGEDFVLQHSRIKEFCRSNKSGLVLLHGASGSGKSTYLYHLLYETKKKMIYIPNNVVGHIANPEFVNFLVDSAMKSIIVVEDAEKVLVKRATGFGDDSGVSTLLNLTDGMLGRILQCAVICTFNISRTEIDPALLRKGRLQIEHEFHPLDVKHANKLMEALKIKRTTDIPLTLADIYNESGGRETGDKVIGFQANG